MCLSEPSKARLNRKKGAREGRARAPLAFKDEERKREKPLKRKYYGQTYCRARLTVVVTVDVFGKTGSAAVRVSFTCQTTLFSLGM
jgi:hypothetical protein